MSFAWDDFGVLARELLDASEETAVPDALIRAALGRIYYAVFGVARDRLRAGGVRIPAKSTHASVRRALGESTDVVERNVGRALVELFRWRGMADYDASPAIPLTRGLAEHAYLVGQSALVALNAPAECAQHDDPSEPDGPRRRP